MYEELSLIVKGNRMSVTTDAADPWPLRTFSIVDFNRVNSFLWLIWSPTHNDQIASSKCNQMLVSADWSVRLWFWRSYPIPTTVSMFSQSPNVVQSASVRFPLRAVLVLFGLLSSSKDDHHSQSGALFANGCTVVYSGWGANFALKFILLPLKRPFVDI